MPEAVANSAPENATSQSTAEHVPATIAEIAAQANVGQLLLRRALGTGIDYVVLFIFLLALDSVLGNEFYRKTMWLWLGALILYFPVTEGIWGRSLGKLITGTIVVDEIGRPPGLLKAVLRTAARLIEVNPLLLIGVPAAIVVALSKYHQRLGDMMAQTYVVRVKDLGVIDRGTIVSSVIQRFPPGPFERKDQQQVTFSNPQGSDLDP